MKDIFFTLKLWKQRGAEFSQIKDMFFSLNFQAMQISTWRIFADEGNIFYIPSMQTVCSYRVTVMFQSESTLSSCLNVKELLAQNRCDIWNLNECNRTRTNNHLVRKRTLNHLAKVARWLSYVVNSYLYVAFDCMLFSCHVSVWKWIQTL